MHPNTFFAAVLSSLSFLANSSPLATRVPHVVHEKRDISSSWVKRSRLPSAAHLPVRIALSQTNLDLGHDLLMEIADPTSAKYGKHLTPQEVGATFAPSDTTVDATMQWLMDAGLSRERITLNKNRGFINIDLTAKELGDLLRTDYFVYQHSQLGEHAIACDQYHVPSHLSEHINFISPGVGLGVSTPRPNKRNELRRRGDSSCPPSPGASDTSLENCWLSASPQCYNALYNIPKLTDPHPNNSFGIFEVDVSYIQSDMDKFFEQVAPEIPVGTVPKQFLLNDAILSTNLTSLGQVEADLDFQVAWPLVYPQKLTLFESNLTQTQVTSILTSGLNISSPTAASIFVSFAVEDLLGSIDASYCTNSTVAPCGIAEPPKVVSISWAPNELEITPAESTRICNEFLKLGLQGTTVVICTGDGGVADRNGVCKGDSQDIFNPGALVSCPYVTSVGATMITPNASVKDPEVAALFANTTLSSGGGFSNYFPAPWYQTDAVSRYFYANPSPYPTYTYNGSNSSIGADGGRFNRLGRGFPDVSATGNNLTAVYGGCLSNGGGGTSASAPLFASVISLINNERLQAGKSSLGFVNPALYANPQVLNDIVEGENYGCGFGKEGFSAVSGWDPVTGLGTPDYPSMRALLMSLP